MGAQRPDPPQETPGVRVGPEGRRLADELSTLTGQPASSFRIRGAAERPNDVASFLRELLQSERARLRAERREAEADLPDEAPARGDSAVQSEADRTLRQLQRRTRGGRASTILTAISGGEVPTSATPRKTLLGGQ